MLVSALVSAVAFSLVHHRPWAFHLTLFWSGLIFALAFERSRNLLTPITAHASINLWITVLNAAPR